MEADCVYANTTRVAHMPGGARAGNYLQSKFMNPNMVHSGKALGVADAYLTLGRTSVGSFDTIAIHNKLVDGYTIKNINSARKVFIAWPN